MGIVQTALHSAAVYFVAQFHDSRPLGNSSFGKDHSPRENSNRPQPPSQNELPGQPLAALDQGAFGHNLPWCVAGAKGDELMGRHRYLRVGTYPAEDGGLFRSPARKNGSNP
jgi:hypothetical protein